MMRYYDELLRGPHAVRVGLVAALVAAFLLSTPTGAAAMEETSRHDRFQLDLGIGSRLVYSESYELFGATAGLANFELAAGWLPRGADERLKLGLRFGQSSRSGDTFGGALDTRLYAPSLLLDAAFRQPVLEGVFVYLRGGAGAEYAWVRLDDGGPTSIRGGAWAPVLDARVGVQLVIPTVHSEGGGRDLTLSLESGYGWRPIGANLGSLSRRETESDPAPIERVEVDLGELDLSSYLVMVTMGYRF